MNKINYTVEDTQIMNPAGTKAGADKTIADKTEAAKPEASKNEELTKTTEQELKQTNSQGDAYISNKNQQPSGLYNVSKDKDGKTVISYDDPEKKQEPRQISSSAINLKSKRDSIKMKLKSETDSSKVMELKKKLKEIEKQIKNADTH